MDEALFLVAGCKHGAKRADFCTKQDETGENPSSGKSTPLPLALCIQHTDEEPPPHHPPSGNTAAALLEIYVFHWRHSRRQLVLKLRPLLLFLLQRPPTHSAGTSRLLKDRKIIYEPDLPETGILLPRWLFPESPGPSGEPPHNQSAAGRRQPAFDA